jgi:hypothetical protein
MDMDHSGQPMDMAHSGGRSIDRIKNGLVKGSATKKQDCPPGGRSDLINQDLINECLTKNMDCPPGAAALDQINQRLVNGCLIKTERS